VCTAAGPVCSHAGWGSGMQVRGTPAAAGQPVPGAGRAQHCTLPLQQHVSLHQWPRQHQHASQLLCIDKLCTHRPACNAVHGRHLQLPEGSLQCSRGLGSFKIAHSSSCRMFCTTCSDI
jgi:hypothetical protein